jgi:hypothetical protein
VRRRILLTAFALSALAAPALAGCTLRRLGAPPSPYCRQGDPLAGVYHPQRLEVKSRCRLATGTVTRVEFERYDGDVHVDLALDEADLGLLGAGNDRVGYDLVVEIIPQDRSVVAVPEVGTRVTVVGPWVEDTSHGWREIHPAWWVSSGRIIPASPQELARVRELLRGGEYAEPD